MLRAFLAVVPSVFSRCLAGSLCVFRSRSQLKLDLRRSSAASSDFCELLQLVLLLPHLARYLLYCVISFSSTSFLDLYWSMMVGNPLQCVQKVSCGSNRVCHRQMPVVVGVLVVTLDHEAVVSELQTLFECPFARPPLSESRKVPRPAVYSPPVVAFLAISCKRLPMTFSSAESTPVHLYYIKAAALLISLHHGTENGSSPPSWHR